MPSPLHELRLLLNGRPFQPFTLIFENRDQLLVTYPDQIDVVPLSLAAAVNLSAKDFAASYCLVRIGGARRVVRAVEYGGADGFPVELLMGPGEEEWAAWRQLHTWAKYRRLCKLVIGVAVAAMIVSPFWSGDSPFDCCFLPMNELLWRQKVVTAIIVVGGAVAGLAAVALYLLDRKAGQSFRT